MYYGHAAYAAVMALKECKIRGNPNVITDTQGFVDMALSWRRYRTTLDTLKRGYYEAVVLRNDNGTYVVLRPSKGLNKVR
jgi:hypothetical protein